MVGKSKVGTQTSARPPAAVELMPEGVLAAALPGKGEAAVYAFRPLAPGVLVPGIDEPNLREPRAVTDAIRTALDDVSPRTHSVTLVLPDTVVRVFVLDFDSLPAKAAEVIPVLRFRLRKMVPFDVEKAGVSYQVLSEDKKECRVLIAVLPGPILEEYEAAVRAAGYEPGAVLPSSLAALATLDTEEPVLAACLSGYSLTTSITHGQTCCFIARSICPMIRRCGWQKCSEILWWQQLISKTSWRCGRGSSTMAAIGGAQEFARWIKVNDPEMNVVDLAARPTTGAATPLGKLSLAGIAGALAGAT